MAASSYKLPQVTALFWILKIAATTLGETGGDLILWVPLSRLVVQAN
ncbi:hypothetical protein KC238_24200 [Mycobacteroides chelonae]|nr:hypothetical protein [Mycobacteroides chelonae]MBV0920365.1 hypothetical protein [Mycobacteroides chelonae]